MRRCFCRCRSSCVERETHQIVAVGCVVFVVGVVVVVVVVSIAVDSVSGAALSGRRCERICQHRQHNPALSQPNPSLLFPVQSNDETTTSTASTEERRRRTLARNSEPPTPLSTASATAFYRGPLIQSESGKGQGRRGRDLLQPCHGRVRHPTPGTPSQHYACR